MRITAPHARPVEFDNVNAECLSEADALLLAISERKILTSDAFMARYILQCSPHHGCACAAALRLRVAAAFFAEADRAAADRDGDALPPSRPPLRDEAWLSE
jgi:hypothetical protein